MDCLFCKIANKEVSSEILYEDDIVLVFLDINQWNVGHTLIIPKKHVEDIKMVDNETLNHMFEVALKISEKLMDRLGATGVTYLHLHICPYYKDEKEPMELEDVYELLK